VTCLLYGATGYTGRLLARRAAVDGPGVILSGRSADALERLGAETGLATRRARLDDPAALDRALDGVRVVLNAAGPFSRTARPLVEACLARGVHYLDLTGEIEVLAWIARQDARARERGVLLLPAVGFIAAASDCLVAHVARRLPGAVRLELGISRASQVSRGSMETMVEMIRHGVWARRGGRLVTLPLAARERRFDFGDFGDVGDVGRGPRSCLPVHWADVVTAHHALGIPDVTAYLEVAPLERAAFLGSRLHSWWLRTPPWQALLRAQSRLLPEGPSAATRARERRSLVAELSDGTGRRAASRLDTPESYEFTARVALAIVGEVLAGAGEPGFRTPSQVVGPDFVLGVDGVRRTDLTV
jgi:short subunit dehydrogenase-like uncharacterized protein